MEEQSIFDIYNETVAEMVNRGVQADKIEAMTNEFDKSTSREQALQVLNSWRSSTL